MGQALGATPSPAVVASAVAVAQCCAMCVCP
jgi:hypothetical protein